MTSEQIRKHWHVIECPEFGYYKIIDDSEPPHETNNWGIIADGCPSREDAEQFIRDEAAKAPAFEPEFEWDDADAPF